MTLSILESINLAWNPHFKPSERIQHVKNQPGRPLPAEPDEAIRHWADFSEEWLSKSSPDCPRKCVLLGQPDYPQSLTNLNRPPLILFGQGDWSLLDTPCLAIVGSRNASAMGMRTAADFAQALAHSGWTIVSGLAEGIDEAAHHGSLRGGGRTVAVFGCGLDRIYPRRNASLAESIATQGGLLLSEYPCGIQPRPAFFPQRNRIIAGLSEGTLVVEAALRSGSLITARQALEAGRAVMALPGSIHSPHHKGCNHMIKNGATLVETIEEIETELKAVLPEWKKLTALPQIQAHSPSGQTKAPPGTLPQAAPVEWTPVWQAMGYDASHVDSIILQSGLSAEQVMCALTEMELDNLVLPEAGGFWRKCA